MRRVLALALSLLSLTSFAKAGDGSQTVYFYYWMGDADLDITPTRPYVTPQSATVGSTSSNPSSATFSVSGLPRGWKVSYWAWAKADNMTESQNYLIFGKTYGVSSIGWAGQRFSDSKSFDWQYNEMKSCGANPSLGVQLDPIRYNIAFEKGNSSATGSMEPMKDLGFFDSVHLRQNAFARTGYSLSGWATNTTTMAKVFSDGQSVTGASFDSVVKSNDTVTLYACWTANVYTVTFESNGGSVNPATKSVTYDATYESLPTPTWDGHHTFGGWYTALTGGTKVESTTKVTAPSNHVLYAQWGTNSYTITMAKSGTGTGTVSGGGTYVYGAEITLTATPDGHSTFVRWADGETENPRQVTVTGDATYTAEFGLKGYTITTATTGVGTGTVSGGGNYDYGAKITLTATPDEHSRFVRWTDGATANPRQATVTGDATYTAEFGLQSYTITLGTTGDGEGFVEGDGSYQYGTEVSLTATPDKDSSLFVQWTDGVMTATRKIIAESNVTYTAEFVLKRYDVTFRFRTETGGITNVVCTNIAHGTDAEAPNADIWDGHAFLKWDPQSYRPVTSTHTETAQYDENSYTIQYDGNGGTCAIDKMSVKFSQSVQLLNKGQVLRTGYEFLGWSTNKTAEVAEFLGGQSVSGLTDVAGGVVTLYAVWSPIAYRIAFEPGQGATGKMEPMTNILYDVVTNLTPNAFSNGSRTFLHWICAATSETYEDCAAVTNLTTTADATVTLTAVWDAPYWVRFEPNGGEGEMAVQRFESAESKALASNAFTRTGYTFAGWKTNGVSSVVYLDGAVLSNGTFEVGTTNALTAVWDANTYSVVFDPGCLDATGGMDEQKFVYDQEQALTQNLYTRDPELWSFTGWSNTLSGATYKDKQTVSNLTVEANGKVTLVAQWKSNLSELSQALDCYNLNWTNEYDSTVWNPCFWNVTGDAEPYGGTCVVQPAEGGDSRVVLSATIHTNGTLTFYWKPTAAVATLTVQLTIKTDEGKQTQALVERRTAEKVGDWNLMSVEIPQFEEASAAIQLMHENDDADGFLYIDHVTWTPEGGSGYPEPGPGDARNVSALSMTAEGLSLSFEGDENFAYHLLATDSLSPMNWYDFGETNVGTGAKQVLVVPVKDIETVPQRFFKIETLQRTK